jgi:uncharacterized protein YkwD
LFHGAVVRQLKRSINLTIPYSNHHHQPHRVIIIIIIIIRMPSPWSKNARSVGVAVERPPTPREAKTMSAAAVPHMQQQNDKRMVNEPLSKKGQSLMYYEPDPEILAARNCLVSSQAAAAAATAPSCRPSSSCFTLPNSASSMSDDDPALPPTMKAMTTASTCTTPPLATKTLPVFTKNKKKNSFKTCLKAELRRLDEMFSSSSSRSTSTTTELLLVGKTAKNGGPEEERKNGCRRHVHLAGNGFYSSNHVMVNHERALFNVPPLRRSRYLDALALSHALDLASYENEYKSSGNNNKLPHSVETLPELRRLLSGGGGGGGNSSSPTPTRKEVGGNVQCGVSIRAMHQAAMMMQESGEDDDDDDDGGKRRRNILREAYTEFGMATARSKKDGLLYMVQLFRGPPPGATATTTASTSATTVDAQEQARGATTTATRTLTTTTTRAKKTLKPLLRQEEEQSVHDDEKEFEF